jgi:hypothetical protein
MTTIASTKKGRLRRHHSAIPWTATTAMVTHMVDR